METDSRNEGKSNFNPPKVENFLFNGIILGWFALQNIFINEKFYCWNPEGDVSKEEILANLATNKDLDIHGLFSRPKDSGGRD